MKNPGIVISALRGGSGKTILTVGIIAALKKQGYTVAPFKKGPDYIDAGWLALAAGRPCYNLDTYLIDSPTIRNTYSHHTQDTQLAVIEGNRGLYDSIDIQGETSTAELAKLLNLPVILCIDGTKTTRTMAAVVSGCAQFDDHLKIKGVILNRVAGPRHEKILRDSIEHHCGIPVLGAVPKLGKQGFPERHMGLVPTPEHDWARSAIDDIAQVASDYLDIQAIRDMAVNESGSLPHSVDAPQPAAPNPSAGRTGNKPVIGIIRDAAFQFYYPENLDALRQAGAELYFISPFTHQKIPALDGIYIGGGFPETHAPQLAESSSFRNQLKQLADDGMPIYAECGGLMYLGQELVLNENRYPMAGILPVVFGFSKRPQGHGYTIVNVNRETPYFPPGTTLKGHEFHYSHVLEWKGKDEDLAFTMVRGAGFLDGKDGVCHKNVLATYTHIHSLGTPSWAGQMVGNALAYKSR